jgi:hypothetical protein
MRRMLIALTLATSMLALSAGATAAAGPAAKACMGKDMSHYARYGFTFTFPPGGDAVEIEAGSGFGHFHYFFAQVVFHGMGEPTLTHMSGSVQPGVLSVYNCGE